MSSAHRTFISLCLAYIISQFHRSSLAVISVEMQREFGMSVAQFGLLSSLFFIAFTAFQIPAGLAYDKYGARKTMVLLLFLNAAGSAFFALAPNYEMLSIARIVLGIGNSALLMGAIFIVAKEFSGAEFAKYSGWLLAVGTIGNLISTTPMAYVSEHFGWRSAFWFFTVIALAFTYILGKQIKEYPIEIKAKGRFADVLKAPDFWKLFAVQLAWYGGTMSLFALWGRLFLRDYHGLGDVDSGKVLMLLPIASILAYLTMGKLDQKWNTRKRLVVIGVFMNACTFMSLALFPTMPLWLFCGFVFLIGAGAGFFPFMLAHGRGIFSAPVLGVGMSTLNFANIGGVGLMQLVTSQLYEIFLKAGFSPPEIYPKIFLLISVFLGLSGVFYSFSKDVKPL